MIINDKDEERRWVIDVMDDGTRCTWKLVGHVMGGTALLKDICAVGRITKEALEWLGEDF